MKTISVNRLRAGDILLCVGDSETAKTILKSTGGKFSHTAVVVEINGILYVFDAQLKGCKPMLLDNWIRKWEYEFRVFRNPNPKISDVALSNWYLQFSGVDYDVKGFSVGIVKSFLINSKLSFLVSNKTMHEKYKNNGLFWCSELTMKLYVEDAHQYTPQNVFDWVQKNNWYEII